MPPCIKTVMANFIMVKLTLPYNVIIGWPLLHDLTVSICIRYLNMKFPTENRVGEVKSNQCQVQNSYLNTKSRYAKAMPRSNGSHLARWKSFLELLVLYPTPNQKGPYRVMKVIKIGINYPKDLSRMSLSRIWNLDDLRKYIII